MSQKAIPRNRNEQEIAGYRDVLMANEDGIYALEVFLNAKNG